MSGLTMKGVSVGKNVVEDDFRKEIIWNKECPCCNSIHGKTNKEYHANDMIGNAVKIRLLDRHSRTSELYGYILTFCDDCNLLYNAWKTL